MANAADVGNWIRRDKRLAIYLRDGEACVWCGATQEDGAVFSLDHVTPCELGGDNTEANLVTSCMSCNCSRRDKTVRQWLAYLRDNGVDTSKLAAKVRRHVSRKLTSYRKLAKQIISNR